MSTGHPHPRLWTAPFEPFHKGSADAPQHVFNPSESAFLGKSGRVPWRLPLISWALPSRTPCVVVVRALRVRARLCVSSGESLGDPIGLG